MNSSRDKMFFDYVKHIPNLPEYIDERGKLIVIEGEHQIPFSIKRAFYICDVPQGAKRGNHANRCTSFFIICTSGECRISVMNESYSRSFTLKAPNEGLLLPPLVWKEMEFLRDDTSLLVLCDTYYETEDVIEEYEELLQIRKNLMNKEV